jgi:hypothetical protein
VIPTLASAYSVPAVLGELLGWVLGAVALVPGRVGSFAVEVRETAVAWGIPVAEITDLYASFPARLALAAVAVALVCAAVVLGHGVRERRRTARAARR